MKERAEFLLNEAKQVLAIDIDENELKTAKVYTEYHTCGDRRIDIAIIFIFI